MGEMAEEIKRYTPVIYEQNPVGHRGPVIYEDSPKLDGMYVRYEDHRAAVEARDREWRDALGVPLGADEGPVYCWEPSCVAEEARRATASAENEWCAKLAELAQRDALSPADIASAIRVHADSPPTPAHPEVSDG